MVGTRPELYRIRLFRGPPYGPPLVWASSYDTDFATDASPDLFTGTHVQAPVTIDGHPAFLDVQPVSFPNGVRAVAFYFHAEARDRTIADTARRITVDAVVVIALQLIALIFATYALVLRRVRRLQVAAAAVAAGDLSVRLPARRATVEDELDSVSHEFDRMVRAVEIRTRQQAAVAELGRLALAGAALPALFTDCVRSVASVLDTEVVVLFERTAPGLMTLRAASGIPTDEIGQATTPTGRGSQAGFTLLSGEPVVVVDRAAETRFAMSPFSERHALTSGATVVVGTRPHAFGVLGANTRVAHSFSDDDISFLQSAANVLAEAIEREAARAREQETEQRYRLVVENSADLIVLAGPDAEILFASPSFQPTLGYQPSEIVGLAFANLAMEGAAETAASILRHAAGGDDVPFTDLRLRDRDGRPVITMGRAIPIDDEHGETTMILIVAHDITEQQAAQEERRRLLGRLLAAQEEERSRIAADIHDDPIQTMTAVALRLQSLRHLSTDPTQLELLDRLEDTVSRAIQRLRRLMFELRPPALDREGLVAAIGDALADAAREHGFAYQLDPQLKIEPDAETRGIAYRIAKEALVNIVKHAQASRVEVLVASLDNGVRVRIRDDGVGFDIDRIESGGDHIGLTAIRERSSLSGGWCRVTSAPGEGTTVEYFVPGQAGATTQAPNPVER